MTYPGYKYLWPPRPETKIAPRDLGELEKMGWWGQAKMNGTCCTIYCPPIGIQLDDRACFAMGRHGPENKIRWQPGEKWAAFARSLPGAGQYVFVGELLHDKGVGVRDTVYLFDLLVADGDYLAGRDYCFRYNWLRKLCERFADIGPMIGGEIHEHTHTVVGPGLWLARNHAHSFREWFATIPPEGGPVEGLVFKNPTSPLVCCTKATANASWQAKCRRATNHLSF